MNIKSVTVCRMNEIYINLILKWTGKRTGKEPETNFVTASIVGKGTGGSHLSCTAVKRDSHFAPDFCCQISLYN